jgi:transketolase
MNEELNIETTRNDENEVTVVMDAITDRSQVINRLQEIVSDISLANKTELEHLKQGFYKLLHTEQEAKKADYVANGGNIEEYVSEKDELEEQYKQLMKIIKEKRAAQQEALEIIRKENLKKKYELLDRFNALIEKASTENVPFNEVKAIQKEWKEIKEIPADKVNELWKSYQQCSEKFYDIQKLNNEFREYDFKKNLETKLAICEEAEKLTEAKDIVAAFRKLQKLHIEFRETGPIAKELREEIWTRFKSASTTINRRLVQSIKLKSLIEK